MTQPSLVSARKLEIKKRSRPQFISHLSTLLSFSYFLSEEKKMTTKNAQQKLLLFYFLKRMKTNPTKNKGPDAKRHEEKITGKSI